MLPQRAQRQQRRRREQAGQPRRLRVRSQRAQRRIQRSRELAAQRGTLLRRQASATLCSYNPAHSRTHQQPARNAALLRLQPREHAAVRRHVVGVARHAVRVERDDSLRTRGACRRVHELRDERRRPTLLLAVLQQGVRRGQARWRTSRHAPSAAASPRRSPASAQRRARRKPAVALAYASHQDQRRRLRRKTRSVRLQSLAASPRTAGQAQHVHGNAARAQGSNRGRKEPASPPSGLVWRTGASRVPHMDSSSGCAMTNNTDAPGAKRSAATTRQ